MMTNTSAFGGVLSPAVAAAIAISLVNDHAPLVSTLLNGHVEKTVQPEFKFKIQALNARTTQINNGAGYNNAATTLTVDDSSVFNVYDIVHIERSDELIAVTVINSGTSITVVRGAGTVAAAAINDDDVLRVIGQAFPEGAPVPADRIQATTEYENYTQIFRRAVNLTNTLDASGTITEGEKNRRKAVAFRQTLEEMEHALWFGQKAKRTDSATGNPQRQTQGFFTFANANVTDGNGTLTEAELNSWFGTIFRYGSPNKALFAASDVIGILGNIYGSRFRYEPESGNVGTKVGKLITSYGELTIKKNYHFTGAVYGKAMAAVDLDVVALRPLQNRLLQFLDDVKKDGTDGKVSEWLGEYGIEWGDPLNHGWMKNISQAG